MRMEKLARDVKELRRRQDAIDRKSRGAKRQDQQGDADHGPPQRRGRPGAVRGAGRKNALQEESHMAWPCRAGAASGRPLSSKSSRSLQ